MVQHLRKVTAAFMLLTAVVVHAQTGLQVTVDGQTITFTDAPSNAWYAPYVRDAAQLGIVSGYRDANGRLLGLFGPADDVTLAQTLKIAVEGAGYDLEAYGTGSVINHWADPYLRVAGAERFTVFSTSVNIDRAATRAEVARIFTDAFRVNVNEDATDTAVDRYDDVTTGIRFADSIGALTRDGILNGDTDLQGTPIGRFRPLEAVNRAETTKVVMLARARFGEPGQGQVPSSSSSSRSSSSMSSSSSTSSVASASVSLTTTGFSPTVLRIQSGTLVTFRNNGNGMMWIASDPHPAHTDYLGLDAGQSVGTGGTFTFRFARTGTWGYHNHVNPGIRATVVVE